MDGRENYNGSIGGLNDLLHVDLCGVPRLSLPRTITAHAHIHYPGSTNKDFICKLPIHDLC